MDRHAFTLLHDAESSWWYQGRALVIARVLERFIRSRTNSIIDVGAGFGGMANILTMFGEVTALEPDQDAEVRCRARGYKAVVRSADATSIPKGSATLIALFDVLEHTSDDKAYLDMLWDALDENGALICTVTAFQWLWSEHDVLHHHYRRYDRSGLIQLIEAHGFRVRYASYWNATLFLPAALMRLTGRSGSGALSLPRMIDRIMYAIVWCESRVLPSLRLPFGTGIVLFAEKITPSHP